MMKFTTQWLVRTTAASLVAIGLLSAQALAQNTNNRDSYDRQEQRSQRNQTSQYRDQDEYQSRRRSQSDRNDAENQRTQSEYRGRDAEDRDSRTRQQSDQQAGLGIVLQVDGRDVQVREVASDSPAEEAGIKRGDQIESVNGRQISSASQLVQLIQNEDPGSRIEMRIRREGQIRNLTARLESRREALNISRDQSWSQSEARRMQSNYGSDAPWGDRDVLDHVDNLERQIRMLQDEVDDLRSMLQNEPGGSSDYSSDRRDGFRFRDNSTERDFNDDRRDPRNRDGNFRD